MTKQDLLMELLKTTGDIRRIGDDIYKKDRKDRKDRKDSNKKLDDNCKEEKKGEKGKDHRRKHENDCKEKGHRKISYFSESLMSLLLKEGRLNQRTIAKRLNISSQAVSEMVKKLELKEFIIKEQGDMNNENMISLTKKGEEKAEEVNENIRELSEKIFKLFSEEDVEKFYEMLEKIKKVGLEGHH